MAARSGARRRVAPRGGRLLPASGHRRASAGEREARRGPGPARRLLGQGEERKQASAARGWAGPASAGGPEARRKAHEGKTRFFKLI